MSKVHQKMGLRTDEFNFFNDQVIAVLAGAGVTLADQGTVRGVLNSLKMDIVSQTICDRYSEVLKVTNKMLMTNVVTGTFGKITAPSSPILKFFNGVQPPGSTDYLNKNKDALAGLVHGLVTFFGGALGCQDGTVSKYGGPSMRDVHKLMGIHNAEFNFFNIQLLEVLRSAGVSRPDRMAVDKVLNTTRTDIVTAQ